MSKSQVLLAGFLTLAIGSLTAMAAEAAKSAHTLVSQRKAGQTDHVVVRLEVGGETKYTDQGKTQQEKMRVDCELDYFEKTLEVPAAADAVSRSIRDYRKVKAEVRVGDGQFKPALKPEHRLIAVEVGPKAIVLFSPKGNLSRDELDAIDIQGNSLLLDRLLPEKPVKIGDHWRNSPKLLAAMLGLDEVAKSTVQSTLKEVTGAVARFEIGGQVEGTIYGVSTKIEIKGRYRFDLRTKRIDWLGMLVKEDRQNSSIEDGIDVVSRLQIIVTPAQEPASLADAALAKLTCRPTPQSVFLGYEIPSGGWHCLYDRRWHVRRDRPKASEAVLLLLDQGMSAGQCVCILSAMAQRKPEELVSLEQFQQEVQQALGKSFKTFVQAGQSVNKAGYRVYRVVAEGDSSNVPMRWIYYLIADPQGHQAAIRFAVEQRVLERLADADKPIVESLRFVETKLKQREHHGDTEKIIKGKGKKSESN